MLQTWVWDNKVVFEILTCHFREVMGTVHKKHYWGKDIPIVELRPCTASEMPTYRVYNAVYALPDVLKAVVHWWNYHNSGEYQQTLYEHDVDIEPCYNEQGLLVDLEYSFDMFE